MDIFDHVHQCGESSMQQGHADGVRDGMAMGMADGRELGLQKGYEIGLEVGFYAGCVRTWRQLQAAEAGARGAVQAPTSTSVLVPERAERGLAVLEELLAAFPLTNPQDEALHDVLERLRGRFKATASMMGLLQDYFPKEPEGETGGQGSLSF